MNERLLSLERAVEAVLTAGLGLATVLLLFGLARSHPPTLRAGIVILMFTPVARVDAGMEGGGYVVGSFESIRYQAENGRHRAQ